MKAMLIATALMLTTLVVNAEESLKPVLILETKGFYRGAVWEIKGHRYILNFEGGVIKMEDSK